MKLRTLALSLATLALIGGCSSSERPLSDGAIGVLIITAAEGEACVYEGPSELSSGTYDVELIRGEKATVELHLYDAPLDADSALRRAITNSEFGTQDWSPNISYREQWTLDQGVFAPACVEPDGETRNHITSITVGPDQGT